MIPTGTSIWVGRLRNSDPRPQQLPVVLASDEEVPAVIEGHRL